MYFHDIKEVKFLQKRLQRESRENGGKNDQDRYRGRRDKNFVKHIPTHIILIAVSLLSIFPFIWLLSTSLKGAGENIFAYPPTIIPQDFTWENYSGVWQRVDLMRYFIN